MCQNRDAIINFIDNFRGHITDLDNVLPILYRKILYSAALDSLARAAFGVAGKQRARIIRLIDELTEWSDKDRISLPQLVLTLKEQNRVSGLLYQECRQRLTHWADGAVLPLSNSPLLAELKPLADREETAPLAAARYPELFYTYRNSLVHEFRQPGYGTESVRDKDQPYYYKNITGLWELVFPVGFFACLFKKALSGLELFLLTADLDPYSQFKFGSRWHPHG